MTQVLSAPDRPSTGEIRQPAAGTSPVEKPAVAKARRRLAKHSHFHHCHRDYRLECRGGRLVIQGRVPSFYLKQVLQEALRDIDGIIEIENQVEVISPTGLSSGPRPGRPRRR